MTTRRFKKGDIVNVLSIQRGKYWKKNVAVIQEYEFMDKETHVEVAMCEGMSADEAYKKGLYVDFHYTRLELVKAVDEEGGEQ